ncbi:hypothetical protein CsSME_00000481 [Camellia sinensis var. sinensis]
MGTRAKKATIRASGSQPSMGTRAKETVARVISSQPNMGKRAKATLVKDSGSQPIISSKTKTRPSIEPSMFTMARPTPPTGFSCISTTQLSTSTLTDSFMFRGRRSVTLSPQKQAATSATNNKNAN